MARKELDLKLLFEELEENPLNPRTYYYLGQTYNLMKEYDKAYRWFQLRGEMEHGFVQERIDALFEAARTANFKLGLDWSISEALYLKAHRLDESRPDSLYFLGIHYLYSERNKAFQYLKQAFLAGYPIHTQYSLKPTLTYHFVPKFLAQLCYEFGDFSLGLQTTTLFLENNKERDEVMNSWHNIFVKLDNNMFVEKPKFVFVADGGFGQWTGRDILTTGMGGSETFVVEMARHIQASGKYNVVVYCNCKEPSYFEHVEYLPISQFNTKVDMDVCMVSRYSEYLPVAFQSNAKQVFFIAHDLTPSGVVIPMHPKLSKVFCLTEWHCHYFTNIFPQLREKVEAFSYGIDVSNFSPHSTTKVKNRFIYSSFPNRGLLSLLLVWPDIVARYPDASLYIYSDVDGQWVNQVEPEMMREIRALLSEANNIVYKGWTDKQSLYNAWATAEYWYYPCTFKETFCLTAFEAAASKTVCITNGLAGLQNTVGDRGFIANTLDDLFSIMDPTRENERNEKVKKNYEYVCKMSWESRASELLNQIRIIS